MKLSLLSVDLSHKFENYVEEILGCNGAALKETKKILSIAITGFHLTKK